MPVYYSDDIYGSGKTAFAVYHSLLFNQYNPKAYIYSNIDFNKELFELLEYKTPNFVYTPYFVLPINEIKHFGTTLIIIDDIKSAEILNYLILMIGSMSRKIKLDIIITAQYYTMITRELRNLSKYKYEVMYSEIDDCLYVKLVRIDNTYLETFRIRDLKYFIFPFYRTEQVVDIVDKNRIIKEILRICKTKKDIDTNIQYIFGSNKETKKSVKRKIYLKKGYDKSLI